MHVSNRIPTCTGCSMCSRVCPSAAIIMKDDEEGFLRPYVLHDLCVDCGICVSHCHALQSIDLAALPKHMRDDFVDIKEAVIYAAKSKVANDVYVGSSGGIAPSLARFFLKQGGCVCGCAFDENMVPMQIMIENESDLDLLSGSKYVQSNLAQLFQQIELATNKGRKVLFFGTGCQIAALYNFPGLDRSMVYTCDLVCHGTPSRAFFAKRIAQLESEHNAKIIDMRFRPKGEWKIECHYEFDNGKTLVINPMDDPYCAAFLKRESYCEACYACPYVGGNRQGDLSLGDLWKVADVLPEFEATGGVSLVVVNSPTGQIMFDTIKDSLDYESVDLNDVIPGNVNLVRPSQRPDERDGAYERFLAE